MAPIRTAAVLLRAHDYGDTSRILRFYTESHGLLSVMARGLRGRSGKGTATVASFASGELTAFVKAHRDLHTMKDFTCSRMRGSLAADVTRFAGASCLAELVLAHAEAEPHPGLFEALERELDRLEGTETEAVPGAILAGIWGLTGAFGFEPRLDPCVRCDTPLLDDEVGRFDLAAGGVRCAACGEDAAGPRIGPIARRQLSELLSARLPDGLTRVPQHLGLVSDFIAYHVVPRPLKSFRFLGELLTVPSGEGE